MLLVSMPNSETFSAFVETATKCLAMASFASSVPSSRWRLSRNQRRAACALASVSCVVKVFDATTKSVSAGSRSANFEVKSAGSTLETKRPEIPAVAKLRRACVAIAGPRSDPPMPIFTTVLIVWPVTPSHSPERKACAKSRIRARTSCTSAATFCSSTCRDSSAGRRSAVCSTVRSSVELM